MTTDARIMASSGIGNSTIRLSCVLGHPLSRTPTWRRVGRKPRCDAAAHDAVEVVARAPPEPARNPGDVRDDGGDVTGAAAGDHPFDAAARQVRNRFEHIVHADAAPPARVQHTRTLP